MHDHVSKTREEQIESYRQLRDELRERHRQEREAQIESHRQAHQAGIPHDHKHEHRSLGKKFKSRLFLHASAPRSVAEALVLSTVFVLFILQPRYAGDVQREGFMALICMAVMVTALHMRLSKGAWWRQILYEGLVAVLLSIPLAGLAVYYGLNLTSGTLLADSDTPILQIPEVAGAATAVITLLLTLLLFALYRISVRLWVGLAYRRKRKLRWNITVAALLVVAALAVLMTSPILWLDAVNIATLRMGDGRIAPLYLQILFTVPAVITYLVLLTFVLAILLPPFALFSMAVTRGMTRRLDALVAATNALQDGDYTTRITV
jgi:hypothetical protein